MDIGPEGTQFAQPVTLAFDASLLPSGTSSADVVIYTAPAGSTSYQALATTLADGSHVQAQTSHFSVFVAAVSPDGGPADMAVADLSAGAGGGTDLAQSVDAAGTCAYTFGGTTSGPCTFTATCNGHTYLVNCQVNACFCSVDGTGNRGINYINACASDGTQLRQQCMFP